MNVSIWSCCWCCCCCCFVDVYVDVDRKERWTWKTLRCSSRAFVVNVSICSNIEIHQQELSREAIRRSTEHRTFFYKLCPEDTIVILRSFLLDSRVMFFHCFDLFFHSKNNLIYFVPFTPTWLMLILFLEDELTCHVGATHQKLSVWSRMFVE